MFYELHGKLVNMEVMEGVTQVKSKYVDSGKIPEDVFNKFVDGDRSRTKKYVGWMAKQYIQDPGRPDHIVDVVNMFDTLVRNKRVDTTDIYQYGSLEDLETALSSVEDTTSKTQKVKDIKKDVNVILDTENVFIVEPKTHEASCFYGKGTKWCTTSKETHYWNLYYDRGSRLYYIMAKKTKKKYAVLVSPSGEKTVYDELDHTMPFDKLKQELGF